MFITNKYKIQIIERAHTFNYLYWNDRFFTILNPNNRWWPMWYIFQARAVQTNIAGKTIKNERNISWSLHCLHLLVHLIDYVDRPLQLGDVGPHQVIVNRPDLSLGQVLLHKTVLPYLQDELSLPLLLARRLCLQFLQLIHQNFTALVPWSRCHHVQPWRFLVLVPIAQDRLDALLLPRRLLLEKFKVYLLPCRAKTIFKIVAGLRRWKLVLFDSTLFLLIFLCFIYGCVLGFESDTQLFIDLLGIAQIILRFFLVIVILYFYHIGIRRGFWTWLDVYQIFGGCG